MSDTTVVPPTTTTTVSKPASSSRLPSYVGILIIVLSVALFAAVLFVPKPQGTTDAEIQQVLTIMATLLGVFGGWQYGSSVSTTPHKDDTVTTKGP